jgi:hypothetical protein
MASAARTFFPALAALILLAVPGRSAAHDQPFSFIDVRLERGVVR